MDGMGSENHIEWRHVVKHIRCESYFICFLFWPPLYFLSTKKGSIRHFNVVALQHQSLRTLCILLIRLTTSMRSVRAPHWLQGFDMSPCQVSTRNTHKVYVLQFLYHGDAKSTCCRMCKEVHRLFNWKYQNTLDFARFLGHLKNDLDTPHPILLSS